MRTALTHAQVSAIIERYCEEQDVAVNFLLYQIRQDGTFNGVVIDHDGGLDLEPIAAFAEMYDGE